MDVPINPPDHRTPCREDMILQLSREARKELEGAFKMEPHKLEKEVDIVEMRITRIRDCLIDRLRGEPGSPQEPRWREALRKANIALSYVVGVEYPATGIHRELLKQADAVLKDLMLKIES